MAEAYVVLELTDTEVEALHQPVPISVPGYRDIQMLQQRCMRAADGTATIRLAKQELVKVWLAAILPPTGPWLAPLKEALQSMVCLVWGVAV
jgi:hypothetical protein